MVQPDEHQYEGRNDAADSGRVSQPHGHCGGKAELIEVKSDTAEMYFQDAHNIMLYYSYEKGKTKGVESRIWILKF